MTPSRTTLITGAAAGIGAATATRLAAKGDTIARVTSRPVGLTAESESPRRQLSMIEMVLSPALCRSRLAVR